MLVPINFMLNADESRYILEHSGARMLCVDSGLAELGRAASAGTAVTELVWLPGEDASEPTPGLLTFDQLRAHAAVVVAKAGHVLTEEGVLSACEGRLAHFKRPKRVILTDALPKNLSGRLLKRELRLRYGG